jgi:hypothetical protein
MISLLNEIEYCVTTTGVRRDATRIPSGLG